MNEERFYELAMKSLAGQCTAEEKAELQFVLSEEPERAAELSRLHAQLQSTKEVLALVEAANSTRPLLSSKARERLRKRAESIYGEPSRATEPSVPKPPEAKIIEAEVVPPKPYNVYKILFFLLILILMILGGVYYFVSCRGVNTAQQPAAQAPTIQNPTPQVQPQAPSRIASNVVVQSAPLPAREPAPPPVVDPQPAVTQAAEPTTTMEPASAPAATNSPVTSASRNRVTGYRGSKWVKIYDGKSKPESEMAFYSLVPRPDGLLTVMGAIGNTNEPRRTLMLLSREQQSWKVHQVDFSDPSYSVGWGKFVDASSLLIYRGGSAGRIVAFLDEDRQTNIPNPPRPLAVHVINRNHLYLHCSEDGTFEYHEGKVSRLDPSAPESYVMENGAPTRLLRAEIKWIGLAKSGETMGICEQSLVRYDRRGWNVVAHLRLERVITSVSYLSGKCALITLTDRVLIVNDGLVQPLSCPNTHGDLWKRGFIASEIVNPLEGIVMDNLGGIFHCKVSDYEQSVAPVELVSAGFEAGVFTSAYLLPGGRGYALRECSKDPDELYELLPQ